MRRAKCFNAGMSEAVVASATPKESVTVKIQKIATSSLKRMQPLAPKPATYFSGRAKNTARKSANKIVKILSVILELITLSNYTLAKESCRTLYLTELNSSYTELFYNLSFGKVNKNQPPIDFQLCKFNNSVKLGIPLNQFNGVISYYTICSLFKE